MTPAHRGGSQPWAPIDWARLARALDFYVAQGFERLELDWHAPLQVCRRTCPDEGRIYPFDGGHAWVGSAEQAFMQAQDEGRLAPGRAYVALTPCFRREPVVSDTHRLQFMKVELFVAHLADPGGPERLCEQAARFMASQTHHRVDRVLTAEGWDLEVGGLEVGSYAARRHGDRAWTCGTGLAEPRFSVALARADRGGQGIV